MTTRAKASKNKKRQPAATSPAPPRRKTGPRAPPSEPAFSEPGDGEDHPFELPADHPTAPQWAMFASTDCAKIIPFFDSDRIASLGAIAALAACRGINSPMVKFIAQFPEPDPDLLNFEFAVAIAAAKCLKLFPHALHRQEFESLIEFKADKRARLMERGITKLDGSFIIPRIAVVDPFAELDADFDLALDAADDGDADPFAELEMDDPPPPPPAPVAGPSRSRPTDDRPNKRPRIEVGTPAAQNMPAGRTRGQAASSGKAATPSSSSRPAAPAVASSSRAVAPPARKWSETETGTAAQSKITVEVPRVQDAYASPASSSDKVIRVPRVAPRPAWRGAPESPTPTRSAAAPSSQPVPSAGPSTLSQIATAPSPPADDDSLPFSRLAILSDMLANPPGDWSAAEEWPVPAYQRVDKVFVRDALCPPCFGEAPTSCIACINKNARCKSDGFGFTCENCHRGNTRCSFTAPERVLQIVDDIRPLSGLSPDALSRAILRVMQTRRDADLFYALLARKLLTHQAALEDLAVVFINQQITIPPDIYSSYFENTDDVEMLSDFAERLRKEHSYPGLLHRHLSRNPLSPPQLLDPAGPRSTENAYHTVQRPPDLDSTQFQDVEIDTAAHVSILASRGELLDAALTDNPAASAANSPVAAGASPVPSGPAAPAAPQDTVQTPAAPPIRPSSTSRMPPPSIVESMNHPDPVARPPTPAPIHPGNPVARGTIITAGSSPFAGLGVYPPGTYGPGTPRTEHPGFGPGYKAGGASGSGGTSGG
ncbi:hypothetical protein MVEN_00295800 [Mycena venus]|uniref:Zn(2)-C6 fungal-type domain-containing protein n=1 Tax=Mycena venus TaxID=2733690 RepID=A0A8H6YYZ5_9AGAR|nr:hypothetical protein MVEN_00295800 [Mycena venus]